MAQLVIKSFDELEALKGSELGKSDYHTITQDQINKFAEATIDHQWIHTDPERAKKESPFGNTIAHGYLTVSLLAYLWEQVVEVQNIKLQVNYGIDSLKFSQPVLVDSKVRLVATVVDVKNLRGVAKANIGVKMEIEGSKKPAFEGEIIFLYHFK
ncbi:MaoC family dehydratase [Labilibacter marinus]|uniref:MaoC family dehydratase n=1 Tax=Labilibacter marinus TaxID=1477105 RepID=UPI0009502379|nr:MaoC family dehydratase [Labilibacter marinus]